MTSPVDPLPCGRDAATAWDRAEAGLPPDAHERGCPHCAAARADAERLHPLVFRLAAQPVPAPDSVLERTMRAVRAELGQRDLLRLDTPLGPARLSHPAAAAVLRRAVDRIPGVRARSCRIGQPGGEPDPAAAEVAVTLAARFGTELPAAADAVRRVVAAVGVQALGLPVRRVDITVVDVYEEPGP